MSPEAFGRRKALSLLKILALHCGRPVHREALVEWLWPDASGDAGLNSLHVTVHALRAALEPDASAPRRSRHVRCSGEQFSLELPPDAVDLVVYRSLLSNAHAAFAQRRTSDAATTLERATALYCGDLFDDTPYEEWCAAERQELRRRQLDALFELGSLHLRAGRAESAVETFRGALRIEPAHEDFACVLIEALLASGRRAEAALEYRERVRLLREQLDVEPSPALRSFAHLLGPT